MKQRSDPRHQKRIHKIQQLFAWQTNPKGDYPDIQELLKSLEVIDQNIKSAAPAWPINQINKIDLAILRLSFFELLLIKEAPPKVVIDEAVELAKEYGGDSSPGFVNGVLGKLVKQEKIQI